MIVTRQRKKKQSSLPILLPIAAIAMLAIALTWPPSRNFITNGPLKPVATVFDGIWGTVSKPLSFAYQQQQITDRNTQIKDLNDKLEADRKAQADKDAQVTQLQKQIAAIGNPRPPLRPRPFRSTASSLAPPPARPALPRPRRPPRRSIARPSNGRPWTPKRPPRSSKSSRRATFRPFSPRCRPTRSVRSWTPCPRRSRP